jgi:carbamoyl-phosphate synthase large subunit
MGGTGGGIAYNKASSSRSSSAGIDASPTSEVLIEESVLGWKEYEMEVVRDKADNCIIVCSIENLDPMGVHTGDSITVAPALTLTDKEYQIMRDASLAVLREIGVETGGSNVQFAVNPGRRPADRHRDEPARLALVRAGLEGDRLPDRQGRGEARRRLHPRRARERHHRWRHPGLLRADDRLRRHQDPALRLREISRRRPDADHLDEVGRRGHGDRPHLRRILQKALRGLETGLTGLDEIEIEGLGLGDDKNAIRAALAVPTPDRILKVAQAMRLGVDHEQIHRILQASIPGSSSRSRHRRHRGEGARPRPAADADRPAPLKAMGFSDKRLARLAGKTEAEVAARCAADGVRPVFKRIDTCAAEFAAPTAYMYSTYETPFAGAPADEARPSDAEGRHPRRRAEPHRPGHRVRLLLLPCLLRPARRRASRPSWSTAIPETVSTDYDTSDRLYFEPLTAEDVLEILRVEQSKGTLHGVIVQFGGQTPLKLARSAGRGRHPDPRHLAGCDRPRRGPRPLQAPARQARLAAEERHRLFGRAEPPRRRRARPPARRAPVLRARRPRDGDHPRRRDARDYLLGTLPALVPADVKARYPNDKTGQINTVLGKNPLLFDRYLTDAIEVDVDALCDGKDVFVCRHHGAHRGSRHPLRRLGLLAAAALALAGDDRRARAADAAMALALDVGGLMNVQYAIKDGEIYVLEVNPRASRTVPFVAKTIGVPFAKIAARIMAGEKLASFGLASRRRSTTSPSRKPSSRSPASPASTPCSARRCARPAR